MRSSTMHALLDQLETCLRRLQHMGKTSTAHCTLFTHQTRSVSPKPSCCRRQHPSTSSSLAVCVTMCLISCINNGRTNSLWGPFTRMQPVQKQLTCFNFVLGLTCRPRLWWRWQCRPKCKGFYDNYRICQPHKHHQHRVILSFHEVTHRNHHLYGDNDDRLHVPTRPMGNIPHCTFL